MICDKIDRQRRNLKLRKQGLLAGNGDSTPKPKNPPKKELMIPSYIYVCVYCDENNKWKDQKEEALKEGIGYIREGVGSMCYKCRNIVMPKTIIPTRPMNRRGKSEKTHSCQVCNGHTPCPLKASIGTKDVDKARLHQTSHVKNINTDVANSRDLLDILDDEDAQELYLNTTTQQLIADQQQTVDPTLHE
ncbi:hypothetical protein PPL_07199 [Heterostelium album PN500]|uniref:Uncharacterized protein n=1 Tax=Heterostelium pallidum (strain ATCC 26659 / Pp 5 / PN500) TaxID=670386 RepID=D3BEN4_HETP5|nr:hypothetical protein PPL_07199 [Heterostelium album PN500]EFA80365.1 hypothetical protein PPL_07199 [Heterostelium album PN500]|eukprot:XP_020432485.1 hypothetical protein PPL_07199 [Heterostelium album PN500]